jgi:hypothetical protein
MNKIWEENERNPGCFSLNDPFFLTSIQGLTIIILLLIPEYYV